MAKYKIGRGSKATSRTDKISVSTRVLGKTYNRSFTIQQVNETYGRALMNIRNTHGQAL